MLCELVVEGLGVIDRAELTLARGCSALTGETGAGKTLVVAALALLTGGRADRSLVREESPEVRVEARFVVSGDHPAAALLRAAGLIEEDTETAGEVEVVLGRTLSSDGRSGKARVNGRLVTVATLAEIGSNLVEITGQRSAARLGSAVFQREVLDAFAGKEAVRLAGEVSDAYGLAARAGRRVEELQASERDRRRELDVIRFEIDEIEAAAITPGEGEHLAAEASRLEHAAAIAAGLGTAVRALRAEGGAEEAVAQARNEVARLLDKDPALGPLAARLESAGYEIADVAAELAGRISDPDPTALDAVRDRLAALTRLRRKYGDDESQVLEYLRRAQQRAAVLENFDAALAEAQETAADERRSALVLAERLRSLRVEAAPRLERAVEELLDHLALGGARFAVALAERDLHEGGLDSVELRVAANPGEIPRPVARVASGGELSRISLAIHLLTASAAAGTMVFDEVDTGVGGAAAHSVGRALADLARRSSAQVLVVTHLPQVAAFADHHYLVTKSAGSRRASAAVEEITGDARVAELSRMLAGLPRSQRARQHAQELLEMAARTVGAA